MAPKGEHKWVVVGMLPESHRPSLPETFLSSNGRGFMALPDGSILIFVSENESVEPSIKYGERRWGAFT